LQAGRSRPPPSSVTASPARQKPGRSPAYRVELTFERGSTLGPSYDDSQCVIHRHVVIFIASATYVAEPVWICWLGSGILMNGTCLLLLLEERHKRQTSQSEAHIRGECGMEGKLRTFALNGVARGLICRADESFFVKPKPDRDLFASTKELTVWFGSSVPIASSSPG
jgi:hypothetical protein